MLLLSLGPSTQINTHKQHKYTYTHNGKKKCGKLDVIDKDDKYDFVDPIVAETTAAGCGGGGGGGKKRKGLTVATEKHNNIVTHNNNKK